MEVCGFGNRISIKDKGCGIAEVEVDNKILLVNCLVISKVSINYTDTLKVEEACKRLMNSLRRKIDFDELHQEFINVFGTLNVTKI